MEFIKKYKNIVIMFTIIFVIILVIGIALGAIDFMYFKKLSDNNKSTTGLISLDFSETGSVINLNNSVPVTDEVGLENTTPYEFTITNTSHVPVDVNIKLNIKNNTTFIGTELGAIRYGLYVNSKLVKKDYIHYDDLTLYTYKDFEVGETLSCKIYFWVDYYYDTPGKVFEATITAEGTRGDIIALPEPTMSLSSYNGTIDCGGSTTLTVKSNSDGKFICSTNNSPIASCSVSGSTITINSIEGQSGNATITIFQREGKNYSGTSKTYDLTINTCSPNH